MNFHTISIVSLVSLVSASAMAGPKVGDTVLMEGTFVSGGVSSPASSIQRVLSHNPNSGIYGIEQTMTFGSETKTEQKNVTAEDIMAEEKAARLVDLCEVLEIGKNEVVVARAGTFVTCRATSRDGTATIWLGAVPFGTVKIQNKDANGEWNLSLGSVIRGQ